MTRQLDTMRPSKSSGERLCGLPRMLTRLVERGVYCLDCKYSLVGLIERVCPECGRPFVLSDPHTFGTRRDLIVPPGLCRPPDGWHFVIAAIASGLSVRTVWYGPIDALYGIPALGLWLPVAALI